MFDPALKASFLADAKSHVLWFYYTHLDQQLENRNDAIVEGLFFIRKALVWKTISIAIIKKLI